MSKAYQHLGVGTALGSTFQKCLEMSENSEEYFYNYSMKPSFGTLGIIASKEMQKAEKAGLPNS